MNRLKTWLRAWLGIDEFEDQVRLLQQVEDKHFAILNMRLSELTSLSADVRMHDDSMVILTTKLGGGIVKIYRANFTNARDVRDFMHSLEYRFGARTHVKDLPRL